ncbi:hypothetical protein [Methylovirgula sp. HY1]|uniref:hypothetical protein n=1 Tax=Methylovirgula sp. HY1 TaxID=2822761 RepID=UPI001C5AFD22|nr:hypothetical protein [Methylovirgula sp. HY1]
MIYINPDDSEFVAGPHLRQPAGEPSRAKTIISIATSGDAATSARAAALHAARAR